ncbi:MAG: hypothetical protein NZ583_00135 [Desulfobacterota bacterium]|nr:hypothetical protein [Thermodesulfobacteriota bacterium]MDW8001122.1 hypothetical protein [Deltaproteobacteria bacterium]
MRDGIIVLLLILFPAISYSQTIYFYVVSPMEEEIRRDLIRTLKKSGIEFSFYQGKRDLEEHLRLISEINEKRKGVFCAIDLRKKEVSSILVAVSNARKQDGRFLRIHEIPAIHIGLSLKIAEHVASSYGKNVIRLPLFPLLGVDMPGLFFRFYGPELKAAHVLNPLIEAVKKYSPREQKL